MKRRAKVIDGRICLCTASIRWIITHLKTGARHQFAKMIAPFPVAFSGKRIVKKRRSAKQRAATRKLLAFNKRRRRGRR